jgi:hypothetical protein
MRPGLEIVVPSVQAVSQFPEDFERIRALAERRPGAIDDVPLPLVSRLMGFAPRADAQLVGACCAMPALD